MPNAARNSVYSYKASQVDRTLEVLVGEIISGKRPLEADAKLLELSDLRSFKLRKEVASNELDGRSRAIARFKLRRKRLKAAE